MAVASYALFLLFDEQTCAVVYVPEKFMNEFPHNEIFKRGLSGDSVVNLNMKSLHLIRKSYFMLYVFILVTINNLIIYTLPLNHLFVWFICIYTVSIMATHTSFSFIYISNIFAPNFGWKCVQFVCVWPTENFHRNNKLYEFFGRISGISVTENLYQLLSIKLLY